MNGARIFSFEQLLMDCEIYDMLRSVTQGFEVSEETLALETIDSTGPQNHYLTTQHTLAHMHEVWQPTVMDRISFEDWQDRNRPALVVHPVPDLARALVLRVAGGDHLAAERCPQAGDDVGETGLGALDCGSHTCHLIKNLGDLQPRGGENLATGKRIGTRL